MPNFLDVFLLQLFNGWVAYSAYTFYEALEWSNKPSWIIAAAALVGLWFSGRSESADGDTRCASRRRVILLFVALVLAFGTARALEGVFERPRPVARLESLLIVPIHPEVWEKVKNALKMQGAFPSDHGAMFAVMTVGVFLTHRLAGLLALAFNLFFTVLRIGIGFHWPTDMLAGEFIGITITLSLMRLLPYLRPLLDWFLEQWERYAFVSYPLAFLVLLDFSQKFAALFTGIGILKGMIAH